MQLVWAATSDAFPVTHAHGGSVSGDWTAGKLDAVTADAAYRTTACCCYLSGRRAPTSASNGAVFTFTTPDDSSHATWFDKAGDEFPVGASASMNSEHMVAAD